MGLILRGIIYWNLFYAGLILCEIYIYISNGDNLILKVNPFEEWVIKT